MKTLYFVYDDGPRGEIEGMFDEDGKLLGTWHNNDACYRQEYFESFMNKLGYTVLTSSKKSLVSKLRKAF